MIVLDGAYGEGGGQVLRTALLLSLLTDQPFRIENIRQGRPQPGLKPQHSHILKALLQISKAQVDNLQPGAMTLHFFPGLLRSGAYQIDIGTAGAIPLFLQTILPAAMFAPSTITYSVGGGTDVRGAMTMDFWQAVIMPFLTPYAQRLELETVRRGYYPAGSGQVKFKVIPQVDQNNWRQTVTIPPLIIRERGTLQRVRLFSHASEALSERRVAERQTTAFANQLRLPSLKPQNRYEQTLSPGSSITAVAEYEQTRLGADALGERNKRAEQVGQEAAERLASEINSTATIDVHTGDNLMIWVALFGGEYTVREISGHIATNAWVIQHFLPGALRLDGLRISGRLPG
jgi:RNA 3'-phosphate cyclase